MDPWMICFLKIHQEPPASSVFIKPSPSIVTEIGFVRFAGDKNIVVLIGPTILPSIHNWATAEVSSSIPMLSFSKSSRIVKQGMI
jgi:hypothetical protein